MTSSQPPARECSASTTYVVGEADTAVALGSGDVPVLATPRLIAWCEAQTVAAVVGRLPASSTSVGTRVDVEHRAPTSVGRRVTVTAELVAEDGRRLEFDVVAVDDATPVLVGRITRVVVDRERFVSRHG